MIGEATNLKNPVVLRPHTYGGSPYAKTIQSKTTKD